MKIDKIGLKNFRVFEEKIFSFNSGLNVIIGNNGTGKTSLLEALSVSLNPFLKVVTGKNVRPIKKEDIRISTYAGHSEAKLICSVDADGNMPKEFVHWQIVRERLNWGYMRTDTSAIDKETKAIVKKVIEGNTSVALPLVKYYGPVRFQRDLVSGVKDEFKGKSSRLDVYPQALNSFSSITQFTDWFRKIELASLQGKEDSKRKATLVKKAIAACVPGWQELRFDFDENSLEAILDNSGTWVPIKQLSDGQKTVMGMVADLVYRCIILNPQFEEDAAKETDGIVLIDEIDIHLHPSWQRKIVGMLKSIFPRIQFIVTTHSPFIIQSLKNEELIDIQGRNMDTDYRLLGLEEIAEGEMGVEGARKSERFNEMKHVADQYFQLIVEGKEKTNPQEMQQLKAQLDQLLIPYHDDPAYVAYLESFKNLLNPHEANK